MDKIRELQAARAKVLDAMQALHTAAEAADRDFSAEEQAQFDAYKAQAETLNKRIARAQELQAEAKAAPGTPYQSTAVTQDEREKDGKGGFASLGAFAQAVIVKSRSPHMADDRLDFLSKAIIVDGKYLAAAPSTYANEASGADGGYLVPPEFSNEVWRLSLADPQNLLPYTENTEISGNSMIFPKDETTPWGGTGVRVFWQQEATAGTATKPVLATDLLRLHKLMALVPVTNELMADAMAIGSYLANVAPERMMWKVNEAILFGSGAGQPKGALSSGGPLVTVAKETGQTAATVVQPNISKMVSRLMAGELSRAIWIVNPDVLPQFDAMTVGNYPIYLSPQGGMKDAPYGMLKGRPVFSTEHAKALGTEGDIALLSLKGYRTITHAGGIQTATSMHLYFDADAMALRWTFRIDGKPILSAPVTPPNSPNTRSHFVDLATRA